MNSDEKAKDRNIITLISSTNRAILKTPPRLTLQATLGKYYNKKRIFPIKRIKKQPTGYFEVNIQSWACAERLLSSTMLYFIESFSRFQTGNSRGEMKESVHPSDTEPDGGFHNVVSSRLKADGDLGD